MPPGRGSAASENFWLCLTRASAQCLRHLHFFHYRCYFVVPCRLYEEAIVTPFAQILHRLRNVRTQYVKLTEYVHEFVNFLCMLCVSFILQVHVLRLQNIHILIHITMEIARLCLSCVLFYVSYSVCFEFFTKTTYCFISMLSVGCSG